MVAEKGGITAWGRNISSLLPSHRGVVFPDSSFHKVGPGWGMQTMLPDDLSQHLDIKILKNVIGRVGGGEIVFFFFFNF